MTKYVLRLPGQGRSLAAAAFISLLMSGVMSGVMILFSVGVSSDLPVLWMRSWGLGFLVSFPTARLIVPPIIKWSQRGN